MATRSLNKVMLIGNLTRDPELRYTPNGAAVCTIGLATNRSWTTDAGERKEETEFHRLIAWNKLAEICSQYLTKGRKIFAEGRLRTNAWQAADGTQRSTTEIVIDDMMILDSRAVGPLPRPEPTGAEEVAASPTPAVPSPTSSVPQPPAAGTKQTVAQPSVKKKADDAKGDEKEDVNPDDIPF